MQTAAYPYCCGMAIHSNFPFDGGGWPTDCTVEKVEEELKKFDAYRTNSGASMIVLSVATQKKMIAVAEKLGYVSVGSFKSTHGDGHDVKVFVKGLTRPVPVVEVAKEKSRFDSVVKKVRRRIGLKRAVLGVKRPRR